VFLQPIINMLPTEYIEVALPVPIQGTFTYHVPEDMRRNLTIGSRVVVTFGRRRNFYTGIVAAYQPVAPTEYEVKDIVHVPDTAPVLRHPQLKLWEWVAEYYLCSLGDILRAALPPGLKIESDTKFELNPDFEADPDTRVSDREVAVVELLTSQGRLSAREIEKATGFTNIAKLMSIMSTRGSVILSETISERFRPKTEKFVRIAYPRFDSEAAAEAFAKVKGAPKQEQMLLSLIHLSDFNMRDREVKEVTPTALVETSKSTSATIKALVDKGIVERYSREISRFKYAGTPTGLPTLSEAQQTAANAIHKTFFEKATVLLHGVSSSGKTEVYAHIIDRALREGKQVLYLVPEIALTTQLTQRLQAMFGERVAVYHSKFSNNERVELWRRLLHTSEPLVVVGTRAAVFLPFATLGLVVVDEEHDTSFKQFDPAPRYNARDTAMVLARLHGAKTLLGSATPSVETYYKALTGKFGLVTLSERYGNSEPPAISIVDLANARRQKQVHGSFAAETIGAIRRTVEGGNQAIVFHNRRGFAPMARCTKCQYIPKCKYCDVSLTYHRRADALICHYCGTQYPMPDVCPACKEPAIEIVGYGTERVEDEVEEIFPKAKILRMDTDTTRRKTAHQRIIDDFSGHAADILVGTQMVTKGLDFDRVATVAVVNADSIVHMPDFRSAERAFNLFTQLRGRAGRRADVAGRMLLQVADVNHPIIPMVARGDYRAFYDHEIAEREAFNYPPFARLIYITLKHRDEFKLDLLAGAYAGRLRELFGNRVAGPAKPPISKIQNLFLRRIMLKVELNASMSKIKEILRDLQRALQHPDAFPSNPAYTHRDFLALEIHYDVDPT